MKLKAGQLGGDLRQQGLRPVYLLYGDEPLQEMECADAVRAGARREGYSERRVFHAEGRFDWGGLLAEAGAMSLFATRRLLELRLAGKAPDAAGGKTLERYLEKPPRDTLLLILAGKLDSKAQKAAWFQAAEKIGVTVLLQAPDSRQFMEWLARRLKGKGLNADRDALTILAERAEGNLLAADQEIQKLALLYPDGQLDAARVLDAVADSARFVVFDWIDSVLAGDAPRVVRQLQTLRAEGVEAILLVSLLTREIRTLCRLEHALRSGSSESEAMSQLRIWFNRKPLVMSALKRHSTTRWHALLGYAGRIERMVKGAETGDPWAEMQRLGLAVAGARLPLRG